VSAIGLSLPHCIVTVENVLLTTIAIGLSLPRRIGICVKYIKLLFIIFIIVFAIVVDANYFGAFVASCP